MKFFIVLAAIVAATAAAPCPHCLDSGRVHVVQDTIGNYNLNYDIGSSSRSEARNAHDGSVHGSFSYHDRDGILRTVAYTSGVNGFQVSGAHLPVPVVDVPAVAIARHNHYLALQRAGGLSTPFIPHHAPLYAPLPVRETPEVAAARAEHLRLHAIASQNHAFGRRF